MRCYLQVPETDPIVVQENEQQGTHSLSSKSLKHVMSHVLVR
jgi:hypothetical protein